MMNAVTAVREENDQFESWCEAAARSGGQITIPEHQAQDYQHISQAEGAYNGLRDKHDRGRFHSQCRVKHPRFGMLTFNFWAARPIFAA